jgi:recombination endonuclease VII
MNKIEHAAYMRKYYATHPEYAEKSRAYQRERRRTDPTFRERERIRHQGKGRLWLKEHPEKRREYSRKNQRKRNGILNATGEEKHGPCEICGTYCKLSLDHDHNTGRARGWLCRKCNSGIGYLEDKVELLQKAIAYLEKTGPF